MLTKINLENRDYLEWSGFDFEHRTLKIDIMWMVNVWCVELAPDFTCVE